MVPDAARILRASLESRQEVTVERAVASSFSEPRRQRMMAYPSSIAMTAGTMVAAMASPQSEVTASDTA